MRPHIRTLSGKEPNPLDLRPEDVCIEDIAHSLSQQSRFCGHTKRPISIAQHSVYVARLCANGSYPDPVALQALLHDASEAYLGDVTRWLKHTPEMAEYRKAEKRAQTVIYKKFGCPVKEPKELEEADRIMVRFEGVKGFGPSFRIGHPDYPPLTKKEIDRVGPWGFWSAKTSRGEFMIHFRMYDGT